MWFVASADVVLNGCRGVGLNASWGVDGTGVVVFASLYKYVNDKRMLLCLLRVFEHLFQIVVMSFFSFAFCSSDCLRMKLLQPTSHGWSLEVF